MGKRGIKTGDLKRISKLTSQQIESMTREELIRDYAKVSKTFNRRVRYLKDSNYAQYSNYLKLNEGKSKIIERKVPSLSKMTTTRLRSEMRKLSFSARALTTTIGGVKGFIENVETATGRDVRELTKEDWDNLHDLLKGTSNSKNNKNQTPQGYASEDIIAVYERDLTEKELKENATKRYDARNGIKTENVSTSVMFEFVDD